MAKRRNLDVPSNDDLDRIEAEFRRETSRPKNAAPIAQVAADAAAMVQPVSASDRAETARLQASDTSLKHARDHGLLIVELPLNQINADVMIRDRAVMDEAQMQELRDSIAANGLRLPIEVFAISGADEGDARYGLLSGYRRLMAMRGLLGLAGDPVYGTIRAIVRPRPGTDSAYVAMVEENEVRAELSHFERGRISVIAAQQGAFLNTEDAVNRLFATSSKAKRSKVRSFATIFEELGDMLNFPDALTEKRGLQLSQALNQDSEGMLRDGLANGQPQNADEEWALLDSVMQGMKASPPDPRRGGRPRTNPVTGWNNAETLVTSAGISIRKQQDSKGYVIRLEGAKLDDDLINSLLAKIQTLLEAP